MDANRMHREQQVSRSQTSHEESAGVDHNSVAFHYAKHHGYTRDAFAEPRETTQFNGIRVVDEAGSGDPEEFKDFGELNQSGWEINYTSAARLTDGTILYEGSTDE